MFPESELATKWRYSLDTDLKDAVYVFHKHPHDCEADQANLPNSERAHLQEVISKISKRRRKAKFKVELMLDDKDYQFFKLGLNNWLNNPQYTQTSYVPIESILPDLLVPVVGGLWSVSIILLIV